MPKPLVIHGTVAITILAFCQLAQAATIEVAATIKSTDVKAREITVVYETKSWQKTIQLVVAPYAEITIDGKPGTLESLKPDQKATVLFDKELLVATKVDIKGAETGPAERDKLPPGPSSSGKDSSTQLFDGKSLNGWYLRRQDKPHCWSVEDGLLVCKAKPNGSYLCTTQGFTDFVLHLDFLMDRGANSGVYLRGRYEVQLVDALEPLEPTKQCGAIVTLIAPTKNAYRGPNTWNTLDVRLTGRIVTVTINGQAIIERKWISHPTPEALDDREDLPGPLMLQCFGDGVTKFRNITITQITQ